jgi:tetratricopeptide (TPR) repeat protein
VPGLTGALATQQAEAIAEASARTGRPLGPVEADGYWWREGLRVRAQDPAGSLALVARRAALTLDNAEHGLDYAPKFDANPVRWLAPLPFAGVLALAVFGVAACGFTKSGGGPLWSAIAIAALAPLLFYVSSRHRLPVAWLLAVPAGVGLAAVRNTNRRAPFVAAALALVVSLAVPSRGLARSEEAAAFASLADVERRAGRLEAAETAARRATEADASSAVAWFNRGVIAGVRGNRAESEQAYRAALAADPTQPDAAANLSALLVASGRAADAPPVLERALAAWPRHSVGWTNLVVAYAAAGDPGRARDAVRRAQSNGVGLDPELVDSIGREP